MSKRVFISSIAIVAIVGLGVVSCKDKEKKVTSVQLDRTTASLKVNGTLTLTATVLPADADDKTVTWSSDKPAVATVVEGLVTAKSEGVANITVTTKDGSKTATCVVTVKGDDIKDTSSQVRFKRGALSGDISGMRIVLSTGKYIEHYFNTGDSLSNYFEIPAGNYAIEVWLTTIWISPTYPTVCYYDFQAGRKYTAFRNKDGAFLVINDGGI